MAFLDGSGESSVRRRAPHHRAAAGRSRPATRDGPRSPIEYFSRCSFVAPVPGDVSCETTDTEGGADDRLHHIILQWRSSQRAAAASRPSACATRPALRPTAGGAVTPGHGPVGEDPTRGGTGRSGGAGDGAGDGTPGTGGRGHGTVGDALATRRFRYRTGGLDVLDVAARLIAPAGADGAASPQGSHGPEAAADRPDAGSAVRRSPPDAEVVVAGELCYISVATLEDALGWILAEGARTVTVDLAALELCTAAGVALLEAARQRLDAQGGSLHLHGAVGIVAKVLDICRVTHDRPHDPA